MSRHVLLIVENQSLPFDKRVWQEASALKQWGYDVSAISPMLRNASRRFENIDGIRIYRHPMPIEANGKLAFLVEYANALFWELLLSIKIFLKKPFQVIHAANPPDHIFIIAALFKLLGVKFIFDHHDIVPENYLAKFATCKRTDPFHKILLLMEKVTFKTANIVIATNESYKRIAMDRGKKRQTDVFVVRNGPDLGKIADVSPNSRWKDGFDYLVTYIGGIGVQERLDVLLKVVYLIVNKHGRRNIRFIVIGEGPDLPRIKILAEKMGLSRYFLFTGYIPYSTVYEILSTADVGVNPEFRNSFTDKSTMIKIMDYMTFGKPIVQFETTEGKVTARDASLYVSENSEPLFAVTLLQLLNNTEKRKEMGDFGKKRIKEVLCWDNQKKTLKNAYKHLFQPS